MCRDAYYRKGNVSKLGQFPGSAAASGHKKAPRVDTSFGIRGAEHIAKDALLVARILTGHRTFGAACCPEDTHLVLRTSIGHSNRCFWILTPGIAFKISHLLYPTLSYFRSRSTPCSDASNCFNSLASSRIVYMFRCGPMKQLKAMMKRIDGDAWKKTQNIHV